MDNQELERYFTDKLKDGSLIEWLLVDNETVIATAAIVFMEFPPTYTNPLGIGIAFPKPSDTAVTLATVSFLVIVFPVSSLYSFTVSVFHFSGRLSSPDDAPPELFTPVYVPAPFKLLIPVPIFNVNIYVFLLNHV